MAVKTRKFGPTEGTCGECSKTLLMYARGRCRKCYQRYRYHARKAGVQVPAKPPAPKRFNLPMCPCGRSQLGSFSSKRCRKCYDESRRKQEICRLPKSLTVEQKKRVTEIARKENRATEAELDELIELMRPSMPDRLPGER